jgi:hypothetical protein
VIDDILAELGRIRDRLTGEVDRLERSQLLERRDELRAEAREVSPEGRSDLEYQLSRLVEAWDRLQRQRIDVVKQAGDLAAGNFGFTTDAVNINRRIDAAAGREELEARIRELKAKLARFDSPPD